MNSSDICMDCKKRIIVLVGIHGSGKTTIGMQMQKAGFSYFPEIGTDLRKKTDKNVSVEQIDFDRNILQKEIERDRESVIVAYRPVIETWHIGNFAFAMARCSRMEKEYHECLEMQLHHFYPFVMRLEIDESTFYKRNTEKNIDPQRAMVFYQQVDQNTNNILHDLQEEGLIITKTYNAMCSTDEIIYDANRFVVHTGEAG